MNYLFKATGIPVDRSKSGLVDSMALLLEESDEMIVAVPAENTFMGAKVEDRILSYSKIC